MTEPSSPYLELMKNLLTDYHPEAKQEVFPLELVRQTWKIRLLRLVDRLLRTRNFTISKTKMVLPESRANGYDWPANACTMIGNNRLSHIELCMRSIIRNHIPGDLVEAGIWRGGAVMFMKAVLNELGVTQRTIWAADSFQGIPKPDAQYAADAKNTLYLEPLLAASLEEVKINFKHFGLLDEGIVFLEGLFKETLPHAAIHQIALLRIDCDLYGSTKDVLNHLYSKVSPGGYIVVDDYHAFPECKLAVDEFREQHHCTVQIEVIDKEAVYWQKGVARDGH